MDISTIKAADLVARVGISRVYAHQLLAGGKTPSLEKAVAIEREVGIPVTAWPLPKKAA
jgi:transcriptional regulator with XRE-family HTH domain